MKKKQPLELYTIDYNLWNKNFREKIQAGDEAYKIWFFQNAKKVVFSDETYEELIEAYYFSANMYFLIIHEHNQHQLSGLEDGYAYFTLPDASLRFILSEKSKHSGPDHLTEILQQALDKELYILVKYDKKNGWWDYDKEVLKYEENQERMQAELRKAMKNR